MKKLWKTLPSRLRYLLIFSASSYVFYLIDCYIINITGFLIGALITILYILKGDRFCEDN